MIPSKDLPNDSMFIVIFVSAFTTAALASEILQSICNLLLSVIVNSLVPAGIYSPISAFR